MLPKDSIQIPINVGFSLTQCVFDGGEMIVGREEIANGVTLEFRHKVQGEHSTPAMIKVICHIMTLRLNPCPADLVANLEYQAQDRGGQIEAVVDVTEFIQPMVYGTFERDALAFYDLTLDDFTPVEGLDEED